MLPGFSETFSGSGADEQYTPKYIFDALGVEFHLDPCAPEGGVPWIPARNHYHKAQDGLAQEWRGNVWLNPPYSKPGPWIHRMDEHGYGIALVMADVTRRWFREWGTGADTALFLSKRVDFVLPDGQRQQHAPFPSVLLAWGKDNSSALRNSGLGWLPNLE